MEAFSAVGMRVAKSWSQQDQHHPYDEYEVKIRIELHEKDSMRGRQRETVLSQDLAVHA